MRIKQYQVDAFASVLFTGNPAAVCVLDTWLPTEQMQAIAQENNLSETAFIVPDKDTIGLRWFTPVSEVDLCGHATLASAHVLFEHLHYTASLITFQTLSGELTVRRHHNRLQVGFPQPVAKRCTPSPTTLLAAFGQMPDDVWAADDHLLIFDNELTLQSLQPDFTLVSLHLNSVFRKTRSQAQHIAP